jgi:hypothetical protein
LVKDLEELERYSWCGFGVLMGKYENSWQKTNEVMKYFGNRGGQARAGYRKFMEDGIERGRRPDLTGGGLIRSRGGIGNIFQTQEQGFEDLHDPRILGSGNFVRKVLRNLQRFEEKDVLRLTLKDLIERVAAWSNLSTTDITSGSKRTEIARARAVLSYLAVRLNRIKTTEVADFLNVSQSAISRCLLSGEKAIKENNGIIDQILK